MKVPAEKPIRMGSGHCCACASTCNRIGKDPTLRDARADRGHREAGVMTVLVTRDVDGTVISYEVKTPPRGLVDAMRIENLKPGQLLTADALQHPIQEGTP